MPLGPRSAQSLPLGPAQQPWCGAENQGFNCSLKEARLAWNAYTLGAERKTLTKADFGLADRSRKRGSRTEVRSVAAQLRPDR